MSNNRPSPYHYVRPEVIPLLASGALFTKADKAPTRASFAAAILDIGARNPNVVVLDADVSKSIGTNKFAAEFPERAFNFGIAEQNMFAAAAGMATTGLIPFACTYAVFASMRALDQVRNAIHYPGLNVKIAASHSGITPGPDGVTHQGQEDLSIMRAVANSTVIAPADPDTTTLAIHAIAECQKRGGIAAFIDAEHAFDRFYAENLGVDTENLLISQPDHGEQALEIAENLIRSGAIDILEADSVAALVPRREIEGEMGESKVGLQARLMSQAMRKLTGSIGRTGCCCIFINQLREKIGVMFGNPETTTGGNALKFYSSVRLDIRRTGAIKDGQEVIGNRTKVRVVKNKMAPPFKEAEFDIMYGEGISKTGELLDLGVKAGIVEKSGAWFSYDGQRIGQGRENVRIFLKENKDLYEKIKGQVFEHYGIGPAKPDEAAPEVPEAPGTPEAPAAAKLAENSGTGKAGGGKTAAASGS